jgi:hypothetical protein
VNSRFLPRPPRASARRPTIGPWLHGWSANLHRSHNHGAGLHALHRKSPLYAPQSCNLRSWAYCFRRPVTGPHRLLAVGSPSVGWPRVEIDAWRYPSAAIAFSAATSASLPTLTKIVQGWPKLWANFRDSIGIFSQSVGPSLAIWANPVQFSLFRRGRRSLSTAVSHGSLQHDTAQDAARWQHRPRPRSPRPPPWRACAAKVSGVGSGGTPSHDTSSQSCPRPRGEPCGRRGPCAGQHGVHARLCARRCGGSAA